MFYTPLTSSKFMNLVRLAALCAAVALGLVLMTGHAKAGSSDYEPGGRYDLTPPKSMQYDSFAPTPGQDNYPAYQRRNELQERQMEDYRQESLRQERARQQDQPLLAPPSYPGYNPPTTIYGSDGSVTTCTKGYSNTVYCR